MDGLLTCSGRGRVTAATICLLLLLASAAGAQSRNRLANPARDRRLSSATLQACRSNPSGRACITSALADINAARRSEGVAPMVLPGDFSSLNGPQQLLAVTDLERVARRLRPVEGLSAALDADAERGALANQDPSPSRFNGNAWAANWVGGYRSTLEADFRWMYDDGPGSLNLLCRARGAPGCWVHRDNILTRYSCPLVMGAAVASTRLYGPSTTELFVGGDQMAGPGQADAPLNPTWSAIATLVPPGSALTGSPSSCS
jgi:hypothetical protein